LEGLFVFKDNCQAQPKLQFKLSLKAELALFSFDPAPTLTHESIFLSISWSIVAKLAYRVSMAQFGSRSSFRRQIEDDLNFEENGS